MTTIALSGCFLGIWEARSCAKVAFGYIAGYNYAAALFIAAALLIFGLILCIYWRTRLIGIGFIASGILSYAVFLGGMSFLLKRDQVAWRHEPPLVSFGPQQKAAVVIYFRKGTTDQQIEDFVSSVLEEPAEARHEGRDYPAFVSSYLRLLPSQANGFDGCALNFWQNNPTDEKDLYIAQIRKDQRVARIFLNTSPSSITIDGRVP
jgi:hypothetical protein